MSTATTTGGPDPSEEPGEFAEQVAGWLAETTDPAPAGDVIGGADDAVSRRVRAMRAEVAEARQLAPLLADEAPLALDTPRVRRRRKQGRQAAALHTLGQDPAVRAWQAARWRLVLTVTGGVALVLALAWSTAGVQRFAAEGASAWSPGWVFAWLVEPFMSLALLTVVAARAFMATRGRPLDDRRLVRVERLFLGLTLGMNAWPHLPGIAGTFTVSGLVLHILGPIVAVAVVTALPIVWNAFAQLDHHTTPGGAETGVTPATYRGNAPVPAPSLPAAPPALLARARDLITTGTLPAAPSARALQKTLHCGMDDARAVRDVLKEHA
ncbi:conjugal transfer protein TraI [Amycolatopsis sp. NBC_01488]|uniref:conjugal transfer protein TraI n=1 Tax=Amycolatopsis sp. NBC_01488 TaxID=2903563 RepID=UPI002E2AD02C|nr:conjugal transfer protein TraI [Amycolatopsis sp. NBC_01488]